MAHPSTHWTIASSGRETNGIAARSSALTVHIDTYSKIVARVSVAIEVYNSLGMEKRLELSWARAVFEACGQVFQ